MTFEIEDNRGFEEVKQEVNSVIEEHPVVLFMKGTKLMPQCGYSRSALQILQRYTDDITVVNVLEGPTDHYRDALAQRSDWETIPQAFSDGEFIGGADILEELDERGDLGEQLGEEPTNAPF